uniref:hypothetical protein n=1 Tax=Demequina sp. TaxID=2050685 RepID=UPI0025DFCF61
MATSRLSLFWRQYRRRQSGGGAGAVVYAIYVGALVVLIYGAPAIRGVAGAFRRPDVLDVLIQPGTASAVSAVLGGVLAATFAIGTTRGPAVTRPFVAHALATSDVPRRRAFLGAAIRSGVVVVLVSLAVTAILIGPLADADAMTAAQLGAGLVASVFFGLLVAGAWLAGQAARGAAVWAVPIALLAAVAAGLAWPAADVLPWSWAAATWPDGSATVPVLQLVLLAAVALAAAGTTPLLLDSLDGPGIVEQSRRWEGATSAATSGDVSTALAEFRAPPTVGRRWRLVGGRRFGWAVARADLVATARTPLRAVVGVLTLGVGGWAFAAAPDVPGLLGWAVRIGAALLVFAGLGPLSDGLRHAVLAVTTPRLFGVSDGAMIRAHAWAPLLGGIALGGAGAVAGGGGEVAWGDLGTVAALIAAVVLVRLASAAKGPPPLALSAPIITPMGDLSVVGLVAWQLDAVLFAATIGATLQGALDGSR